MERYTAGPVPDEHAYEYYFVIGCPGDCDAIQVKHGDKVALRINLDSSVNVGDDFTFNAAKKHFIIDHPLDPQRRNLVHACIEGPEAAVYYRGDASLVDGRATVRLPGYFEALTRAEGRTVQLTPRFEGDEEVHALAASAVRDGTFQVRTVDGAPAAHGFYWQVTAVRADIDPLAVEVDKTPGVPS